MTKQQALTYISKYNSLKFDLIELNNGTLKPELEIEFYQHIADLLSSKSNSISFNKVKNALSYIKGAKLSLTFTPEEVLSILTTKL